MDDLSALTPVSRGYVKKLDRYFRDEGLIQPNEDWNLTQLKRPPKLTIAYITVSQPASVAGEWEVSETGCKRVQH